MGIISQVFILYKKVYTQYRSEIICIIGVLHLGKITC